MADQKKVDKTAGKISSIYVKGVVDIVKTLLESKKDLTNEEFGAAMLSLDMKEIVKQKMSAIKTEYVKAHVEILKDKKPVRRND